MFAARFGTWEGLKRHVQQRIELVRDELETPGMDPLGTEERRGQIAALRWLMKEVEPDPKIEEPTGTDYLAVTPRD